MYLFKAFLFALLMLFFMGIAFVMGRDLGIQEGRQERGEWIRVMDTSYHYEFKKK